MLADLYACMFVCITSARYQTDKDGNQERMSSFSQLRELNITSTRW